MKNRLAVAGILLIVTVYFSACSNQNTSSNAPTTSGLKFRAFVSNPLHPAVGGGGAPVLNVVDASKDVLSAFFVNLSGAAGDGLIALTPNKRFTVVYSMNGNINALTTIDNITEMVAVNAMGQNLPSVSLSGPTESIVTAQDNATAYVAVPTAPVNGQSPGVVFQVNLSNSALSATLDVPSARYVVGSHNSNRILAFADNSNTVAVIDPSLIGTSTDPRTFVCCFDHPVWGVISTDDTTAYIFNCGAECGGTAASITVLDLNTNTPGVTIPVSAATTGLLSGTTLYVAGTPAGTPCPPGTAATSCGTLNLIDTNALVVTNPSPIIITDGYHNRMTLGPNNQLFIGAKNCTNVSVTGGEIRGCLSMFNPSNSNVVVGPVNGDVTGIAAITGRNVVYVCEGGNLWIYDTTVDALQATQVMIVGDAVDVKLVD